MTKIIKKYLTLNRYYNQEDNFEEFYFSHPNYPSVYALTDTLHFLEIENIAIRLPKEQFDELPDNFLALYQSELVLVVKKGSAVLIETNSSKKSISTVAFIEGWNGVVIAVEPNETKAISQPLDKPLMKYILPGLLLVVASAFLHRPNWEAVFLMATSFLGLLLSVFILRESFGLKNETVSKLCTLNSNTSCDSVIKSAKSRINNWLSFSDLPFVFFGGTLMALLFYPSGVVKIIGLMSLASFPVIAYSVWVQQFQLKKWCLLCLLVAAVVLAQSSMFLVVHALDFNTDTGQIISYLLPVTLFSALWFLAKPILEGKIKNEKKTAELRRFKRNPKLFKVLRESIPNADGFSLLQGLQFGNEESEIRLTLILSPSCGHCHKVFQEAFQLLNKYQDRLSFQVLFNLNPENSENPFRIVAESILTIKNHSEEKAREALVDWHINKSELSIWKEKWMPKNIDMKANNQLYQQFEWCQKNNFNYTPVRIINGELFPAEYEIQELHYFINAFSNEAITSEAVKA